MFNHVSLGITNIEKSVAFYDPLMALLGHKRAYGNIEEGYMAWGEEDALSFIINLPLDENDTATPCRGSHICFQAKTKEQVDAFYKTAIENGATCDGPPGWRPEYRATYYACFILDPDGHQIEAVAFVEPA
ncbi:MAG: VOC family protein [Rhodospirillales bacterium]|nr:VOC family protein [Rhodospirillales bacterium]